MIEDELNLLSDRQIEVPLDGVEAAVWRRIAQQGGAQLRRWSAPVRFAVVLVALGGAGVAGGAAAARSRHATPTEFGAFSPAAEGTPATLLIGDRS